MNSWHPFVFIVPMLLSLAFVASALVGAGESDVQLDCDVQLDTDLDIDTELNDGLGGLRLMSAIGVGKAPLNVVLMILLMLFGVIGLSAQALFSRWVSVNHATLVALVTSTFIAPIITRTIAHWIGRLVPTIETYANDQSSFVGTTGIVELKLSESEAIVRVTDPSGTLYKLRCRSDSEAIHRGTSVLITDTNPRDNTFEITPLNLELERD